jgi:peptide/nickel transport system substrate-binding protein
LHKAQVDPRVAVRAGRSASDRWRGILIPALLCAAALVSSCSTPANATRDPVTLRIGVAAPKTNSRGSGTSAFIGNLLSEPFVGIAWDGRPTDRVAASWAWTPDRLGLSLRMRKGLQFHDGTPLDLAYFKESLEQTIKSPQSQSTAVSYRSVVGIEAEGEDSVLIKLSRPEAFLLTDLANSLLTNFKDPNVGLGPYRLLQDGSHVKLAAFDKYYRGRPNIDFVEVDQYEEQRSSWASLMRGQIDAVHEITPSAVDFVEKEGQTAVKTFPFTRPYFISLMFNLRHPVLKNPMVRQALSYSVDRQAIIDRGLNGKGVVAEGPIWPFHWAYSTAQKTYSRNTEAATLRLDSAGLRLTKPTGNTGQMPSRFRFTCLTVAKDARYENIAMVLQKQLFEIGVDMQIEALPMGELFKRIQSNNYDAVLMERTSGRSLAWTYFFFHSSSPQALGYSAADGPLDRLRVATADGEIRTAVSDFQQILHDDPPAIFIVWPQVARAVSTKFVVPEEKGRDVMSGLWQWKPAEPK